jgi:molybdenum ABC transporter molybdate-binding protein
MKRLTMFVLLFALLLSACAPQATPVPPTSAPATQAPAPTAVPPTAIPEPKTLTVLAAASLTESFTELGKAFEAQNPNVTVTFSFAGSQQLAQQLAEGAPADVFASASKKYMDATIEAKRINKEDSQVFARNRLVVIYPKDNPAGLKELKDLAKSGLKLVLADKSVPVGQYSLDFLDKAIADPGFDPAFKDSVLKNVVSYEDNVKSVLTKVSLGEGDAGIVYVTDITADAADKVGRLDIPDALNTIATYPIAPIADSKNADLAKAFVALVLSPEGQQILGKYGFIAPAAGSGSSGGVTITDTLGREVKLAAAPKRIVITGKALFMIADVAYLFPGAADKIVGLGDTGQGSGNFIKLIDPNYEQKATLAKDAGVEQVAALQPDLVLLKSYLADSVGAPIEALGIPVVYIDFETPDQYSRDLAILGKVFGDDARAAEIASFYQFRMDSIQQAVKDAPKPRTLLLYYNEKDGNVAFNVPPMEWIQTQMVQMAGGEPVWADANPAKGWTQVTLEQIAAWDADQIFVISYFKSPTEVVNGLKSDANWQAIRAVKDGKVYAFPVDLYSWDQPDPRWALGLTWLAGKLHPDKFPGLDMTAEVKSFYKTLYGLDDAFVEKNIVPTFNGVLP